MPRVTRDDIFGLLARARVNRQTFLITPLLFVAGYVDKFGSPDDTDSLQELADLEKGYIPTVEQIGK